MSIVYLPAVCRVQDLVPARYECGYVGMYAFDYSFGREKRCLFQIAICLA